MDFVAKEELARMGFVPTRAPGYLGLKNKGTFILAKHSSKGVYEIHAAVDINGRPYDTYDINGETFYETTGLKEFMDFLQDPREEILQTVQNDSKT